MQLTTDDLGTPLALATFVVVDLETTGGSATGDAITEIGAVKVRGGEVVGEFTTLVNPGIDIPPLIAALTGITNTLVASAPRIAAVLPSLLEFIRGSVLVAHNAPFDIGFLKAACAAHQQAWPAPIVVDTARLARTALHRDEVRNCKLATLAAHFRSSVTPTHRALDDARATVDVLHGLLERVANLGVDTVEDLIAFTGRVSPAQRAKRSLADGLPDGPGVYVFRDQRGAALYVGTTSRSIRGRVRTYFTASETRRRMSEMVGIAERIDAIPTATALEARVRELRLIASEAPRYNRRSTRPDRESWVKLTAEAHPRLSVVREVRDDAGDGDGAAYLGPFRSASLAREAAEALAIAAGIRTCTTALPRTPRTDVPGCVLAELGRCPAPCATTGDPVEHATRVAVVRRALAGDLSEITSAIESRMAQFAAQERFEEALAWRERLTVLAQASVRRHRIAALAAQTELVAGAPDDEGGWELHVIRHGWLAAAGRAPRGHDPRAAIDALLATAAVAEPRPSGQPAGLTEEAEAIAAWLERPGVRLARTSHPLQWPMRCGGSLLQRIRQAHEAGLGAQLAALPEQRERALRPIGPILGPVTRIASA